LKQPNATLKCENFQFSIMRIFLKFVTVIRSNFLKTRIVSYRIFFKNLEKKKQRIKLSNLFQISNKKLNFGIKTNFFKQILQSKVSSYSIPIINVIDEYFTTKIRPRDLFTKKNKKIVLCSICLKKSIFIFI
jgi:hypothetical protein